MLDSGHIGHKVGSIDAQFSNEIWDKAPTSDSMIDGYNHELTVSLWL